MDADPETGRIAVIWPEDIEAAGLSFSFNLAKGDDVIREEQFMLDPDTTAKPLIKKPKAKNLGEITVFRIRKEDIDRARSFQAFLEQAQHSTKAERKGRSLSIRFSPLLSPSSKKALRYCEDEGKAPFYVWYKFDQTTPYKRIIRTKNIDKVVGNSRAHMCKLARKEFAPETIDDSNVEASQASPAH